MPTTSVRLRISLLRRSWELLLQIWRQISPGEGGECQGRPGVALCRRFAECAADRDLVEEPGGKGIPGTRGIHRRDRFRGMGGRAVAVMHYHAVRAFGVISCGDEQQRRGVRPDPIKGEQAGSAGGHEGDDELVEALELAVQELRAPSQLAQRNPVGLDYWIWPGRLARGWDPR